MGSFLDDILQTDDTPYSNDYSFDTKAYMGDFDPLEDNLADFLGGSGSGFNDDGFSVDFLDALYGRGGDLSDYSDSSIDDFLSDFISGADEDKPSGFKKLVSQILPQNKGSSVLGSLPPWLQAIIAVSGASFLKDRGYIDPKRPNVGYQGKIPEYTAVREQVTGRDDTDRRPGSSGRRYFSDTIYAKKPEGQQPMSIEEARAKARAQAEGFMQGGQVLENGGYLEGNSDGQADKIPGDIDGVQEARLSHGEYVLPADLVAILGNGNSDAGAKALDDFMSVVRKKATGTPKQQKNIDADQVLAMLSKGMS